MISLLQKIPGRVLVATWWIAVVGGFVTYFTVGVSGLEEGNSWKMLPTVLFGFLGLMAALGRIHLKNPFSWRN